MKYFLFSLFVLAYFSSSAQSYFPLPSCASMPTNCTIVAVNDGDWDNINTWSLPRIPGNNDKVCIPEGRIVTVKNNQYTQIGDCPATNDNPNMAIFICGTLEFEPSGVLYLGLNSLLQVFDPIGPSIGLIKASKGNSDLIKFGCQLKWNGLANINGPYYIAPGDAGQGVLSVLFEYIKAEQKEPYKVQILWGTAMEFNNLQFLVERSLDQKVWSNIGTVKSLGNSSSKIDYRFDDNNPSAGINFYRIKQVDIDGSISYSGTLKVNYIIKKNISIFPNPVNTAAQLYTKEPFKPGQVIQLIDAKGTRLKTINPTGGNRVQIEMNGLAAGLYLIQLIENGRIIESVSAIKQ